MTREVIRGWAYDTDAPETPLSLLITANDTLIARVVARNWRADLEEAGIGSGRHAFELRPGAALALPIRYVVAVQRESDGTHLFGSPVVIDAPASFDEAMCAGFSALLGNVATNEELEKHIAYLAAQTDRLLQLRADRTSGFTQPHIASHRLRWAQRGEQDRRTDGLPAQRVLVIDENTPRVGNDAGSNVLLSHIASLQRLGYTVTFVPADMAATGESAVLSPDVRVCTSPWYSSVEEVLRRERQAFSLIYLHRIGIAARYLPLARYYQAGARVVFSVADLSHVRVARQATVQNRPELHVASEGRRVGERMAAAAADIVMTHSSTEAEWLRQQVANPAKVHCIRWAVDRQTTVASWQNRRGIAFIGGYAHEPNVDAASWLVEVLMPLVWTRDPGIPCLLVGSDMPEQVRALIRPQVEVLGHVDDLRTILDRVRLTVAPLRFGAGVKGKVVDSLAAGVPCLCTEVAAEGLDLPPELQALVADGPDSMVEKIVTFHRQEQASAAVAQAAFAYITNHFSQECLDADLRQALTNWQ